MAADKSLFQFRDTFILLNMSISKPVLCDFESILNSCEFLLFNRFWIYEKCSYSTQYHSHGTAFLCGSMAHCTVIKVSQEFLNLAVLPLFLNAFSSSSNRCARICGSSFLVCFCLSRLNQNLFLPQIIDLGRSWLHYKGFRVLSV